MINNLHEYNTTKKLLDKFENTLINLELFSHTEHPLFHTMHEDAIVPQIKEFKEELVAYEKVATTTL